MRPGAGRRTGGPGEGSPAGGDCAPARAGEVCLREAAGGSFSALCKLGGRGRAGGAGSRPLRAGGGSGRVGFCTEGACPGSREPRGTAEVGGSPAPREKSLKWKSSELGDGTQGWGDLRSWGGSEACDGRGPSGLEKALSVHSGNCDIWEVGGGRCLWPEKP